MIIKKTFHCTNSIFLKLRSTEGPTLPEIKDMSHPKGEFSRKYNKGLCWKSASRGILHVLPTKPTLRFKYQILINRTRRNSGQFVMEDTAHEQRY